MNCKRLLCAAVILIGLVGLGSALGAGDAKKEPEKPHDVFAGKIMLVHLDPEMDVLAQILSGVEFKEIQGRKYVVGIGADTKHPDDWRTGKKIYVAWDKITGYMLLTKEEFGKYLDAANDEDKAA
jgi:hypothetical protein